MANIELLQLHPQQRPWWEDPKRYVWIEAGTKSGKTLGLASWITTKAWCKPRSLWWWSAPVYEQTKIGWNRCIEMIPPEECVVNQQSLTITLKHNGARIQGRTGKNPQNLFGEQVDGGVIDEAQYFPYESFIAFRTTLTKNKGPLRIAGKLIGGRHWFWKACKAAGAGAKKGHSYYGMATADNPYIDQTEIDDARELLPEQIFKALYENIQMDDYEGTVFRYLDQLQDCEPETPIPNQIYVIGYDPARKLTDPSLTVVKVTREGRWVVENRVLPKASWEAQVEIVKDVARQYNRAAVLADSTGVGDPIVEMLKKKRVRVFPYQFTQSSKEHLIEHLMVTFEKKNIHIPAKFKNLIYQLNVFEYQVVNKRIVFAAPTGYNDDHVMSLALADLLADKFQHKIGFTKGGTVQNPQRRIIIPTNQRLIYRSGLK